MRLKTPFYWKDRDVQGSGRNSQKTCLFGLFQQTRGKLELELEKPWEFFFREILECSQKILEFFEIGLSFVNNPKFFGDDSGRFFSKTAQYFEKKWSFFVTNFRQRFKSVPTHTCCPQVSLMTSSTKAGSRLIALCTALQTMYVLLSVTYEGLFALCLMVTMGAWIRLTSNEANLSFEMSSASYR